MQKAFAALTLTAALGLGACANHPAAPTPANAAVEGVWDLEGAADSTGKPSPVYLSVRPDSQIDPRLMRVSGYSGVNYYTANASVDASQQRFILVNYLGETKTYGSPEQMKAEQHFLGQLDRVVSYQLVSANVLKLTTLTGDTLSFQRHDN